jgi:hypothetical protein
MRAPIVLGLLILASCASQPMTDSDASGQQFAPVPERGVIYVYRPEKVLSESTDLNLEVDGRMLAVLTTGTWLRVEVPPGAHELRCVGNFTGGTRVALSASDVRFYEATAGLGMWGRPVCTLAEVQAASGRAGVLRGRRAPTYAP